jgi:heptosyltransferase-3
LKRILVIRGGAIGDFILTLPALKALREAEPDAHIEILGYKHIAALAEKRFYAQAVRSIEYGSLAGFFAKDTALSNKLRDYFASFDLIISYLYDPDRIFENNLRRCGAKKLIRGPARIENSEHAARQLALPLEEVGIKVVDLAARIFPSAEDRQFASEFLRDLPRPIVAIHPGSGSEKKNWPIENWIKLEMTNAVFCGEADEAQVARLECEWRKNNVRFAKNFPLNQVAAALENAIFIGHDSGISHVAAAAGARCILLFGPTDPAIWAPLNGTVRVIRAPKGDLEKLDVDVVRDAFDHALMRIGMST